jgi:nucleoside-diphosphate-sugar epimerase
MNDTSGLILVTGSNGRIGSALMRRLTGKYGQVIGFDLKAPAPPPPECVRIPVDIGSDESVKEGLKVLRAHHGSKIAAVIHLAAYYDFLGEANPKYDEITVNGTGRLLRGLQDNFEVEQFIFTSTMLVHAPNEPGALLTEDSPLGATWAYPESKVRTEALIRAEHGKMPVAILRLAGSATRHRWQIRSSEFTSGNWRATCIPAKPRTASRSCTWRIWSMRSRPLWSGALSCRPCRSCLWARPRR